ncbi:secreted protein [Phakopsora pachyrhizi]|nr:secreted protein [Phakopsora pachyrhizi]
MWLGRNSILSSFVAAASLVISTTNATPRPLSTSASTTATMEGPGAENSGLLIHVLRTEDLIADKLESKPLLLEKTSHLIIRVELGKDTVDVNGHSLPVLGQEKDKDGKDVPLEMSVTLKQVQMLKMPKDSPLVPLGLSSPELLKISEKYMSEGLVGAVLSVRQEPLSVEAERDDGVKVEAKAYKVTIGIKILEVEGMTLEQTSLPSIDLLHLMVQPDPENPTKVATMTTLAPPELSEDSAPFGSVAEAAEALKSILPTDVPNVSGLPSPSDLFDAAMAATSSSISSALAAMSETANRLVSHAGGMIKGSHHRRPCPGHRHRLGHGAHAATNQPEVKDHALSAHQSSGSDNHTNEPVLPPATHHRASTLPRTLACLIKMASRSMMTIMIFTLPVLLAIALHSLKQRLQQKRSGNLQSQYKVIDMTEDGAQCAKLLDEKEVERV